MKFIDALEKTTNTLLIEATYEVKEVVDSLYEKVKTFINKPISAYISHKVVQKTDITLRLKKFIEKYNPDNQKKIFLELSFTESPKMRASIKRIYHSIIELRIPIDYKKEINEKEIKTNLEHELIHAIDSIRNPHWESDKPKKYHKTIGGYFRMPNEFNAVIHEIKNMSASEKYDKISSKKEFIKFLKNSNQYIFKQFAKLLDENPGWYKKLITRLNREKLIPAQLDLVENVEINLSKLTTRQIYLAGKRGLLNFDYEKGLDKLIKFDDYGGYIYEAGFDWKKFNYEKGLRALKKLDTFYYKDALKNWPKNIKQSQKASKEIKSKTKILPMKKLKLKEDVFLDARDIYEEGINKKNFDYSVGLDDLIKVDGNGYYVYRAGIKWKKFDYKKGLKALKNTDYYKDALEDWPKDIKASVKRTKQIRDTSKKLPKKELKL